MWNNIIIGLTSFKSPLLRTIVPCAAAAFAVQALAAAPSVAFQSERFFDLSGSVTFAAVGILSLYLPSLRVRALALANGAVNIPALPSLKELLTSTVAGVGARDWRQIVLVGLVTIWAARLGSHLFSRVIAEGKDSRFDHIRHKPVKFSSIFFMQAVWVTITTLPVIAFNAIPAATLATALPKVIPTDVLGLGLWVLGFGFEAVADYQKSQWAKAKRAKLHDEQFLTKGLFSKCRYPNYFGEITLWAGSATVVAGVFARKPIQLALGLPGSAASILGTSVLAYTSPAFIAFLLLKVSGIPMSEPKYDRKFGDRKDYQEWRRNTPRLIPKLL